MERAPPQSSQPGGGGSGVSDSSGGADGGSTSSQSSTFTGAPHDRNANNYVMLGTFNLPVNIMDPQQIQVLWNYFLSRLRACKWENCTG